MGKIGFGGKWRKWVCLCISHARFSVLVYVSPEGFFRRTKGIRQGIFVPTVVYLGNGRFEKHDQVSGIWCYCLAQSFKKCNGIVISHLQFADNTMSLLEATKENAEALKNLLIWFDVVFYMKIDLHKSKLYIVGKVTRFEELVGILCCKIDNIPAMYLGLPLGERS